MSGLLINFIFYFYIVSSFISEAAPPQLNHPIIQDAIVKCSEERNIQRKILLQSMRTGNVDSKLKDYNLCILKESGIVETDGKINLNIAKEFAELFFPDKVDVIMKTCCVVKENAEATAFWISQCLLDLHVLD